MQIRDMAQGRRKIKIFLPEGHLDDHGKQLVMAAERAAENGMGIVVNLTRLCSIGSAGALVAARKVCLHHAQILKIVAREGMRNKIEEWAPGMFLFYKNEEEARHSFVEH